MALVGKRHLWWYMLSLHTSTGEGNFRQTNKPFFLTSCQEFKKNSDFHLIIHISFNNSSSSHLVRVLPACCQAAENTLHYTQLGQMLTWFFVRIC